MANGPLDSRRGASSASPLPGHQDIHEAVERGAAKLRELQHAEGYWSFELEADCTISAEYILMMHFMDEVDEILQARVAVYIREHQLDDGSWPLYYGGEGDLSCAVKSYYALKLAGDDADAPHMARAREWILGQGGAARSNVFTRITLALFGQVPWRAVPFIPVEIMLLPRWFPFHYMKVSYWSRTVMIPLFILTSLKPEAGNPGDVGIHELFLVHPEDEEHYFPVWSRLNRFFIALDAVGRRLEPLIPGFVRRIALKRAEEWILERQNGRGGLGAIFPAMVNALEALTTLGYEADHPAVETARQALKELLVDRGSSAYCQPCLSPVWDTALSCLTLQETEDPDVDGSVHEALDWLQERQLLDEPGDWRESRPGIPGGGWPFQFRNDHYPDLDDTAVVAFVMRHSGEERYKKAVCRAADWLVGMQSRNGGFGSFDADNTHYYLNEIPFADHGALLDPPTADVTARCVRVMARLVDDHPKYRESMERGIEYLLDEQEEDGSWFGRWGTNYIYGTWSVLAAFETAGLGPDDLAVRRAVDWLKSRQRHDGGWGEDQWSYHDPTTGGEGPESTSFQTAWALLALMSSGETRSDAVRRGVDYLVRTQGDDGLWRDPWFTAPGFPKVFYLKYHGYDKYFPLMALARYRSLTAS